MKLTRGIGNLRGKFKQPVLTLGVFDGVHLAHQKVIREVVRRAKLLKGTSIVITFAPHPLRLSKKAKDAPLITSLKHRIDLINRLGADVCLILDFNKRFRKVRAEDFIKRVLVETIGVKYLIVGAGFRFGKGRAGTLSLLKKLSKKYTFVIHSLRAVKMRDKIISSSRIRVLIQRGKISEANELLGRKFSLYGKVKRGSARGRILGYPTANIEPEQEIVPAYGVYEVYVRLKNKIFPGILNVGCRPTFPSKKKPSPTIEVHIFNFHKKIYGKQLEVFFIQRIRPERKFASQGALLAQIKKDELKLKKI